LIINLKTESQTDTLSEKIKSLSGKENIDYITRVLSRHSDKDPQKYFRYAENALSLAGKIKYKSGEADVLFEMSQMYFTIEEYKKSLEYGLTAYKIRKTLDNKSKIARSLTYLAINYEYFGKYDSSTALLYQAVKFAEESKNSKEIANAYNALGILNYVLKDYNKALKYTGIALNIRESNGDKKGIMSSMENLGLIHMNKEEYEKAILYHKKILEIKKEIASQEEIAGTLDNLGICYMRTKRFPIALSYFNEALAIRKISGGKRALASSYSQLGTLYSLQGNHSKSLEHLLLSLNLRKEVADNRGIISSLKKIMNEYNALGDYKNAYTYSILYHNRKDSTFSESTIKQINELDTRFKTESKDKEIAILQRDVAIQGKNQILFISAFILASLVALTFYLSNKIRKKTNKILLKKNEEISNQKEELSALNSKLEKINSDKDKLFSIIAHDLKNPFHALLGLSEILNEDFEKLNEEDKSKIISGIYESSRNTYKLLENLLQWSRLQTGRMELNPESIDLYKEVISILNLIKASADAKNITIKNGVLPGIIVYCDNYMINTVLRNLISNAVKFTNKGGTVVVNSTKISDAIQLEISDDGVGMNEQEANEVFEINRGTSKKGTSNEEGTGLGLILCKEFVEKNGGKIWVESLPCKGSTFYIDLPINGATT